MGGEVELGWSGGGGALGLDDDESSLANDCFVC